MLRPVPLLVFLTAVVALTHAQETKSRGGFASPPSFEGATVETYKEVGGAKLNVWIFQPTQKPAPGEKRPAIVFFFGGGWSAGSPSQFERQCRHFASRGMVAITADYRV